MEIWKDIKGYEGLYQISSLGNVKSLNYNRTGKEQVLKQKDNNGYLMVCLCKNWIKKNILSIDLLQKHSYLILIINHLLTTSTQTRQITE